MAKPRKPKQSAEDRARKAFNATFNQLSRALGVKGAKPPRVEFMDSGYAESGPKAYGEAPRVLIGPKWKKELASKDPKVRRYAEGVAAHELAHIFGPKKSYYEGGSQHEPRANAFQNRALRFLNGKIPEKDLKRWAKKNLRQWGTPPREIIIPPPTATAKALSVHTIADRYIDRFARTFVGSVTRMRQDVTTELVAADLALGLTNEPVNLLAVVDDLRIAKADEKDAFASLLADAAKIELGRRGLRGAMTLQSPFVQDAAKRLTANLVTGVKAETKKAIRQVVFEAIRDGEAPAVSQKTLRRIVGLSQRDALAVKRLTGKLSDTQLDRYAAKLLRQRALTIARTETIRAGNMGRQLGWKQMAADGLIDTKRFRQKWMVAHDDRLCPNCAPMDGKITSLGVSFEQTEQGVLPSERVPFAGTTVQTPPLHPRCLPGDALVTTRTPITGYTSRPFEDDLVLIAVAGTDDLTLTANHPILTTRGWVAAGSLHKGDDLLRQVLVNDEPSFGPDMAHEHVPTPIAEVVDALRHSGQMAFVPVPVAPEDFHGDGLGSEVAVVGTDRLLGPSVESELSEQGTETAFVRVDANAVLLTGGSYGDSVVERKRFASGGIVSGGDLSVPFGLAHSTPLDPLSFTAGPQGDPVLDQSPGYGGATDAVALREREDRFTVEVAPCEVLSVGRVPFAGHVYNLETVGGWYGYNDIVVHNCRCTLVGTTV